MQYDTRGVKMTIIQTLLCGWTDDYDITNISLTDSTQELIDKCQIDKLYALELINGDTLISDMLSITSVENNNAIKVGKAFIEIALKASKVNLFFKDFDSSKTDIFTYIEEVLLDSELSNYSGLYKRIASIFDKCKKYIFCVEKTIDVLDLSPNTAKILNANGIFYTKELIMFSRFELLNMSKIGQATIDEIVAMLEENHMHLKGDDYHICNLCKNRFIDNYIEQKELSCSECRDRLNRLKKNKKFELRVELSPMTFKDGSEGFVLYTDVKNKHKAIQNLSYQESYIVCSGRQHSSNNFLSGYRWSDKENILPNSVKTIGLIWYDNYLDSSDLCENDELIIVLYSNTESKSYFFKFIYKDISEGDEEQSCSFVIHDIIIE